MNFKVKNKYGENLEVLVEGKNNAEVTVLFVHGDIVNKDERAGLMPDIATALQTNFRTIRFDYSGFGNSDGKSEDCCYTKMASDLESVSNFVKSNFNSEIYILAHSKASFVTYLLSPDNIEKMVVTGPPNLPVSNGSKRLKQRLEKGDGIINLLGISSYTNEKGYTYKFGPNWWRDIENYDENLINKFALKTNLVLFKPMQDDTVGNDGFDNYKKLPLKYFELNGDHCFSKPEDKKILIEKIMEFFEN